MGRRDASVDQLSIRQASMLRCGEGAGTDRKALEEKIVAALKTVYDPEIPVDIYAMGLIYDISFTEADAVDIKMTLT